MKCPHCGGPPKESVDLGDVTWNRCRNCGWTWEEFKEEEIHGDT